MSSRGARTKHGYVTTDEYALDHFNSEAKVLIGLNGNHSLPDYAHTPGAFYIKEYYDGSFRELRAYDSQDGHMTLEIGYHPEPRITNGNRQTKVLHFHLYDEHLKRDDAVLLTHDDPIYKRFKKYLEVYGL